MPENASPLRLVLVSGSLRAGSLNTAVLRAAARAALGLPQVAEAVRLSIGGLPFFEDGPGDGGPEVARLTCAVRRADGLIIATPEYNGFPPGVLLNMTDWLTRDPASGPLHGLPVATLSASPGQRGGADAQQRLRQVLTKVGAALPAPPCVLDRAAERLDPDGEFSDTGTLDRVSACVEALVAACRPAERAKETSPS